MANEATPQQKLQNFADGMLSNPDDPIVQLAELQVRTRTFFAELAASINTPHVGDVYRDAVRFILNRAIEARLYSEKL